MGRPIGVSMDVHFDADTDRIESELKWHAKRPYVTVNIGDASYNRITLYCNDLAGMSSLVDAVERTRRELAAALGLLPNGEPCALAEVYGSLEWHEHDHNECITELVDEPAPPALQVVGTAWERHDDPTVEDNPLDDDSEYLDEDEDEDEEDDDVAPGNRILRAEGWI